MIQSMLRRSVPALTLAAILFITCAGTAQARTLTPAEQAWSWLREVWTEGVGVIWGGGGVLRKHHHASGAEKSLGANAKQSPTPSSSTPPPSTSGDGGYGVDPNG
jgi:hypothetical protein